MENLQLLAANMIYMEEAGEVLDDPYSAVDWVTALPIDFYPRNAFFKIIDIPVTVQTYKYLLGWLDATPPMIHHFQRLVENAIEPDMLERMQAGKVVGYRPVWRGDFWTLEEIV